MAENKDMENYRATSAEEEEDYFDNVELELDYSISVTEGSVELKKDSIKEQKKYMRAMAIWMMRSSFRTCSL